MQSFVVLDDVRDFYLSKGNAGSLLEDHWHQQFEAYRLVYPDLAAEFSRRMKGELPTDWKKVLPTYSHTVITNTVPLVM